MKYLILGKDSFVGKYLAKKLPEAELCPEYINTVQDVLNVMDGRTDTLLINCIGRTGRPNVDWCESHKEETISSNIVLPIIVAEAMAVLDKHWIHIGSGCVYDGEDFFYTEEDTPNFKGSFYSRSKLFSQEILKHYRATVLRIRMPIDEEISPRSYVGKIVKYAKEGRELFDIPNSMTCLTDLAFVIRKFSNKDYFPVGTFNVVNDDFVTISQILELYKKYCDPSLEYKIVEYKKVLEKLSAGRSNCKLSTAKLRDMGIEMPNIKDRLVEFFVEKGKILDEIARQSSVRGGSMNEEVCCDFCQCKTTKEELKSDKSGWSWAQRGFVVPYGVVFCMLSPHIKHACSDEVCKAKLLVWSRS
jgi:dTDP-4-dehydrorhamnose reductase